jgi:hypothetical protein
LAVFVILQITPKQPTKENQARKVTQTPKHAPATPIARELVEFEAPMSNRKAREILGFKEKHNWREHV